MVQRDYRVDGGERRNGKADDQSRREFSKEIRNLVPPLEAIFVVRSPARFVRL